jgi:hypothetical protein
MSGVLRGFYVCGVQMYASTKTLVRPCSKKKSLIYELKTDTLNGLSDDWLSGCYETSN